MFTDMLLERIGTPSEEITARIAKASPEHLRLWGKRILTAASMAEVFKD